MNTICSGLRELRIKNENGTITLQPINPNYSPQTYGPNDDPVRILGVVKEIRRKI